jgi:HEAT repeat protein
MKGIMAVLLLILAASLGNAQSADQVRGWLAQMRDRSPAERASAAREIAQLGPKSTRAVPVLIDALDDDSEFIRQSVTGALTRIGKPAVGALTKSLSSSQRLTRRQATLALAHIGQDAKPAAATLARLLQDGDRDVRAFAALALVKIDPENRETLPILVKSFDAADKDFRQSVLYALEQLGPKADGVLPLFGKALTDRDRDVCIAAASILARFGPDARAVSPELLKAVTGKDGTVRISVASALAAVDPEKSDKIVPVLVETLKDRDAEARRGAAVVLGQFGSRAKTALPALRQATTDSSNEVSRAAETAIKLIEAK